MKPPKSSIPVPVWLEWVETAKPLLPIPMLLFSCWVLYRFFRRTWTELDEQADAERLRAREAGEAWDPRPLVALVLTATVLMFHEYYGNRAYFEFTVRPVLTRWAEARAASTGAADPLGLEKYRELYGHAFWAFTRVAGYMLPLPVWLIWFRRDSVRDMGLRLSGFFTHAKLYGLFLVVVVLAMLVVARAPDFGTYYPFYAQASRSYWDLFLWECMYFAQFFALEFFFRGWMLSVLRRQMGSAAIFVMCVPYCMIHFGKPYLEVGGAILAGIALGSLAMKTRSLFQGFLLHVTIALSMDLLALSHRDALPKVPWP